MARISNSTPNREILEAALQGLESQRQKLDEQISEVRRLMGTQRGRPRKTASTTEAATPEKKTRSAARGEGKTKRALSPEARKRIAAAQKKRWAAYHKANQG